MIKKNSIEYKSILYLIGSIYIVLSLVDQKPVIAQEFNDWKSNIHRSSILKEKLESIFAAPKPPKDFGAPSRRSSAGSRSGEGKNKKKALIALTPFYQDYYTKKSSLVFGKTTVANPTLWFYSPFRSPFVGEFILKNHKGIEIYKDQVDLPNKPGIINLQLPASITLEVDSSLHWEFRISLKSGAKPIASVDGWILRENLEPVMANKIAKASLKDQIQIYASNGFWYDALNASAISLKTNTNEDMWFSLLKDIGLAKLASEPFVKCCSASQ